MRKTTLIYLQARLNVIDTKLSSLKQQLAKKTSKADSAEQEKDLHYNKSIMRLNNGTLFKSGSWNPVHLVR